MTILQDEALALINNYGKCSWDTERNRIARILEWLDGKEDKFKGGQYFADCMRGGPSRNTIAIEAYIQWVKRIDFEGVDGVGIVALSHPWDRRKIKKVARWVAEIYNGNYYCPGFRKQH